MKTKQRLEENSLTRSTSITSTSRSSKMLPSSTFNRHTKSSLQALTQRRRLMDTPLYPTEPPPTFTPSSISSSTAASSPAPFLATATLPSPSSSTHVANPSCCSISASQPPFSSRRCCPASFVSSSIPTNSLANPTRGPQSSSNSLPGKCTAMERKLAEPSPARASPTTAISSTPFEPCPSEPASFHLHDGGKGGACSELGELVYMRVEFERVVRSADSEALFMINPEGNGGSELSIFLLRI